MQRRHDTGRVNGTVFFRKGISDLVANLIRWCVLCITSLPNYTYWAFTVRQFNINPCRESTGAGILWLLSEIHNVHTLQFAIYGAWHHGEDLREML